MEKQRQIERDSSGQHTISLGLGLALIDSRFSAPSQAILRDMPIVTIGIAMLILLPVVRVIVMLIVYFRQRDYRLAVIALLVLTIILLGFTVGLAESRHRDAPTSPIQARAIPVRSIPAKPVRSGSGRKYTKPVYKGPTFVANF